MVESNVRSLNADTAPDSTLGTLLLESGVLTEKDVNRILDYARAKKLRFGDAAIRLGIAKKADIEHALARQFDYPYLKADVGDYGRELVAAYKPFTPRVEALRALRMQLMLHWFAAGNSSLAIVSANEKEGRTYLAANLAIVFSQLGDRTLLIDANLQRSRMHEIFRVDLSPGLSPALVGRTDGKLSIKKIPHFENLSLLTAGAAPPNPEELLARNEFDDILRQLSSQYDIILIDTPPGSSGIGAESVAYRCGAALLVARQNHTSLADLREFSDRLQPRVDFVGSVLSNF